MTATIPRIRDINEYMQAVSIKQRIEACLSVFIKKSLPTQGIGRQGAGASDRVNYDGKLLSPGMIKELKGAATGAQTYSSEVNKLSKNLAALNTVYGNMLTALNVKMA